MTKLVNDNGNEIKDVKKILNETKPYYEQLYKSKDDQIMDVNLNDFITDNSIQKLPQIEQNPMESAITMKEALTVSKKTANNKSPGTSGYTVEFF